MHAKKLIPFLFLSLALESSALSPEGEKAGAELVTLLKDEIKAMADGDENDNAIMSARQYLRQVQNALAQENQRNLKQFLDNFGGYEPSEKVRTSIETLEKTLDADFEARTQAVITELEGLLATAAEKVTQAEEPEDLDKVLVSLSRNRFSNDGNESYDTNHPKIRRLLSEVSNARQFVTTWQDYLQASNSGNTSKAVQALANVAQQENGLIPRSRIIARQAYEQGGEAEVAAIIAEIRKPDDLREGLRKLSKRMAASRSSGSSSENAGQREIYQSLVRMEKTYREFLAGLPVKIEAFQPSSDSTESGGDATLIQLRAELLRLVMPRALDLPETVRPAENESIDGFLARATRELTRDGNTAAAIRTADLRQLLARSANLSDKDTAALRDYAAGRKQAEASQWSLAVVSLQKALKSGHDLVPAAEAGALLETIRKEHPTEFEAGMTEFLTPRVAPEQDPRQFHRNFFPPHLRQMEGGPDARGGTTVVLPVPGKEATPKPEKSEKPPEEKPAAAEKPSPR
jgi:hypothetical protein